MWVITTSIVIVFLVFVIFSAVYKLATTDKDITWPPHISKCPSYWREHENNMCRSHEINKGTNTQEVHSYDANITDNSDGSKDVCAEFARKNNIFWDGIRN